MRNGRPCHLWRTVDRFARSGVKNRSGDAIRRAGQRSGTAVGPHIAGRIRPVRDDRRSRRYHLPAPTSPDSVRARRRHILRYHSSSDRPGEHAPAVDVQNRQCVPVGTLDPSHGPAQIDAYPCRCRPAVVRRHDGSNRADVGPMKRAGRQCDDIPCREIRCRNLPVADHWTSPDIGAGSTVSVWST